MTVKQPKGSNPSRLFIETASVLNILLGCKQYWGSVCPNAEAYAWASVKTQDRRLCLDITHCLGHPQALSPLSTCQIYGRNTGQLNPVIGRYTDSSIPALKMISADGWNEETTYHFRDGPRHCKTILNTLIFRMT